MSKKAAESIFKGLPVTSCRLSGNTGLRVNDFVAGDFGAGRRDGNCFELCIKGLVTGNFKRLPVTRYRLPGIQVSELGEICF
jgi:hypothetical protein